MNKKDNIENKNIPLAHKLAPNTFEDFIGQEEILGKGKLLRNLLDKNIIRSCIFYGPSGTGKTSLSNLIANKTNAQVFSLNSVLVGVNDLKKIIENANSIFSQKNTLLILDEIHHFNKSQQDVLLPAIEKGIITLIGLTTENPFFSINKSLRSRLLIFEFKSLNENDLNKILNNALIRGFENLKINMSEEVKKKIIYLANGDSRKMLNILELLVFSKEENKNIEIGLNDLKDLLSSKNINYDKASNSHYEHISAFIKSMRGSDANASVYWLSKMLEAGEDPLFIARRILICASEDIGNANPMALVLAQSAFESVKNIGMPEARIILSQVAIYLAISPKSNSSYNAINLAMKEVKEGKNREVPLHLRNIPESLMGDKKYKYPHDYPNHYVEQEYMPEPKVFYNPSDMGFEGKLKKREDK